MTRPIEKVNRTAGCQQLSLLFNLFIVAVFILAGVTDYVHFKGETYAIVILSIACAFFGLTIVFYALTTGLDPGYVKKQPNFLRLLKRLIAENYHLDYVCVPCETLRPENAEHCNFCNRCVQKFDHHCVFVNNCLGYRNHKWFLLFLASFTMYLLGVITTAIIIIVRYCVNPVYLNLSAGQMVFNFLVQIILISVVLLHTPILYL